ncbi:hypothetical protein [Corynebacterium caspium]|uniref:hypothetical protein n=1 Tax=Corynebacterium caspium TaxID=234828 RepID=UPI00037FF9A0|nr:hypothetical protein [Corynebacterium caspium]WKD58737.1 hypothetical protein CCASP_01560 [Corynebacterium caspium DSM 44850]
MTTAISIILAVLSAAGISLGAIAVPEGNISSNLSSGTSENTVNDQETKIDLTDEKRIHWYARETAP